MIKSKKAQFFSFFLIMAVMFVLLGAYLIIGDKKSEFTNPKLKDFGEKQKRIFQIYQEAELDHLVVVMKAKMLWQKPLFDLAARGGFSTRSTCYFDSDQGINFWNKNETEWCLDREKIKFNIKNEIRWFFRDGHYSTKYFDNYVWGNEVYHFFIKENHLSGINDEIKDFSNKAKYDVDFIYKQRHNFDLEMNYNVSEYDEMLDVAQDVVDDCYNDTQLSSCVNQIVKNIAGWSEECEQDKKRCYFQVKSKYAVRIYDEVDWEKKSIYYKFGLVMG